MNGPALRLHFSPLLDGWWLALAAAIGVLFVGAALWRSRRTLGFRIVALAFFLLVLINPSLLQEERKGVADVAVIVVDRSPSQEMGQRRARTDRALAAVRRQLEDAAGLDVRVIEAPQPGTLENRTKLFELLEPAFASVPQTRRAGVIFLTDGQIHDLPTNDSLFSSFGPVSALLSGDRNERDRQIVIKTAPSYGLVGQKVTVKYIIEDTPNIGAVTANVTLRRHDGGTERYNVPVNAEQSVEVPVDHPGQNVFELSVESAGEELTAANNRAAILLNGVRDRLKVLLVSGRPHAGGRTWRDLLTSDPGVDLVHFTILREPQKLDLTPQDELSLIAFPFRELFEIKLYDFDLIIFDRYHLNRILPTQYFDNIARYVREGGAFLEASGPAFAGEDSVYMTSLMTILPGSPTGIVTEKPFRPGLTTLGRRHPVTGSLEWGGVRAADKGAVPKWGRWMRQVDLRPESGDTLMDGLDHKPLLILDRVQKGRVAQIASDHIWLWSRGFDNGGPHAELLRRVVHWLMKEPELDERAMNVIVHHDTIIVRKHIYDHESEVVTMTKPDGSTARFKLEPTTEGWLEHRIKAEALGIYGFADEAGERRYAIIGDINPPELFSVKTTPDRLTPLMAASGGGAVWLDDVPEPRVRLLTNSRSYAGNNWVGLRRNSGYTVTGVRDIALMPEWASLLALLCLLTFAWWREGHMR